MEGERIFMKNKKRLAKLIFVAILLLIIWYTFKDSAGDIVAQLQKTSFAVLVAIMAATVIYSSSGKPFTVLLTVPFTVYLHWEAAPVWQQSCIWEKKVLAIRKQPDFI